MIKYIIYTFLIFTLTNCGSSSTFKGHVHDYNKFTSNKFNFSDTTLIGMMGGVYEKPPSKVISRKNIQKSPYIARSSYMDSRLVGNSYLNYLTILENENYQNRYKKSSLIKVSHFGEHGMAITSNKYKNARLIGLFLSSKHVIQLKMVYDVIN